MVIAGESQNPFLVDLRTDEEIRKNQPPLFAPVATFGDLHAIDREEIEGYRSVAQLIRDYIEGNQIKKPLSIGVFGPPGSGKSFGITQVFRSISRSNRDPQQFNLAQFSSPADLSNAFLRVRNAGTGGEVPLVFFDEFDSDLLGVELGWLRYFLAPMQDGTFFFDKESHFVGRAILVFAGGTSSNFRAFSREDETSEQARGKFSASKGFDFVSRLSGNLNVLGVNPREDTEDPSFVLRRAIVIRGRLKQERQFGRNKRALVPSQFIRKLLNVSYYKHGARSIEMIIRMCVGRDGMLHLPPPDQLVMHVHKKDAEAILS
jgi:hypothetical protein